MHEPSSITAAGLKLSAAGSVHPITGGGVVVVVVVVVLGSSVVVVVGSSVVVVVAMAHSPLK